MKKVYFGALPNDQTKVSIFKRFSGFLFFLTSWPFSRVFRLKKSDHGSVLDPYKLIYQSHSRKGLPNDLFIFITLYIRAYIVKSIFCFSQAGKWQNAFLFKRMRENRLRIILHFLF